MPSDKTTAKPLQPEQKALLDFVLAIFASPVDPERAPTPQAYMVARTLQDFARLMAPSARERAAAIPASAARAQLVAIAHAAVHAIGLAVCERGLTGEWEPIEVEASPGSPFAALML